MKEKNKFLNIRFLRVEMSGLTLSTKKTASGIIKSRVAQVTAKRSQDQQLDTFQTKGKPKDILGKCLLMARNLLLYATHFAE